LKAREVTQSGVRLSCQIKCDHDMTVKVISRLEGSERADQGSPVADQIEPEAVWTTK
jgi:Na+-transporting NADH:ubiquinone oxidoreductase subunit NqrF